MYTTAISTLQHWGNSLAVRIPTVIARPAHFTVGQPVELTLMDNGLTVVPIGNPKLSLLQKLALFDSVLHTGEVMATHKVGKEVL